MLFGVPARAYVIIGGTPPTTAPPPGEPLTNLSQGLFEYSATDLSLAGPFPIAVTRTYRTRDLGPNSAWLAGAFGVGTNLNYDMFLYSNSEKSNGTFTDAEVVLPDGGQVVCPRTSSCSQGNCSDYTDAVFTCNQTPGPFFGSRLTYLTSNPGWVLSNKDGSWLFFREALHFSP